MQEVVSQGQLCGGGRWGGHFDNMAIVGHLTGMEGQVGDDWVVRRAANGTGCLKN